MKTHMVSLGQQLEIFESVVGHVAVLVMNIISRRRFTVRVYPHLPVQETTRFVSNVRTLRPCWINTSSKTATLSRTVASSLQHVGKVCLELVAAPFARKRHLSHMASFYHAGTLRVKLEALCPV